MRFRPQLVALISSLAPVASAETYVVDDDGGPGVDFIDIPPAVAAAQDGDVLLVRAGSYLGFSTDKGITILGQGDPIVPEFSVDGLPAGLEFAARGLSVTTVVLGNCSGTVFLEDASQMREVRIGNCMDVRLRQLVILGPSGRAALTIESASSVEIVECSIYGEHGSGASDNGETGIAIASGSRVHVALSDVGGGSGGNCHSEWTTCYGGSGGDGIFVESGAELIVTGRPSDHISGGTYGCNTFWDDYCGWEGLGIWSHGSTRYSGADVESVGGSGHEESPAIADPFLLASTQAGPLRVEIHGVPGGSARLMIGTEPRVPFADFLVKPAMITQPRVFWVGVIDSSGAIVKDIPWAPPVALGERFLMLLQASVVDGTETVRTNSAYVLTH